MADKTLAWLRKAFNWYASKDDKVNSPIVKGMARTNLCELARTRVLSVDELRVISPLLAEAGTFGAMLMTLLLSAQRRDEVVNMGWKQIGVYFFFLNNPAPPKIYPLPLPALLPI